MLALPGLGIAGAGAVAIVGGFAGDGVATAAGSIFTEVRLGTGISVIAAGEVLFGNFDASASCGDTLADLAIVGRRCANHRVATFTGATPAGIGLGADVGVVATGSVGLVLHETSARGMAGGHATLLGRFGTGYLVPSDAGAGATDITGGTDVAVVAGRPVRSREMPTGPGEGVTLGGELAIGAGFVADDRVFTHALIVSTHGSPAAGIEIVTGLALAGHRGNALTGLGITRRDLAARDRTKDVIAEIGPATVGARVLIVGVAVVALLASIHPAIATDFAQAVRRAAVTGGLVAVIALLAEHQSGVAREQAAGGGHPIDSGLLVAQARAAYGGVACPGLEQQDLLPGWPLDPGNRPADLLAAPSGLRHLKVDDVRPRSIQMRQ